MIFEMMPELQQQPETQVEYHYTVEKDHKGLQQDNFSFTFPTISSIAVSHLKTMDDESLDLDWKLDEFFESIFVINLPQATTRLANITKQLNDIGVYQFEIFKGIDGRKEVDESIWRKFYTNRDHFDLKTEEGRRNLDLLHQGEAGCYLSHYKVIEKVKNAFDAAMSEMKLAAKNNDKEAYQTAYSEAKKYSRVLILEDDCGFGTIIDDEIVKFGAGVKLRKNLRDLPSNWQMLYFVVGILEPTERVNKHIYKIYNSWSLACYAVNYTMYDELVAHLKKIEDPLVQKILPVDNEISSVHYKYNIYAMYPALAYHGTGKSQISPIMKTQKYWQGQPIYKNRPKLKGWW